LIFLQIDPIRYAVEFADPTGWTILARPPVPFGDPGREAPARRRKPLGELRVKRGDLLVKLEEAKVE